jgi:hypothetical protein
MSHIPLYGYWLIGVTALFFQPFSINATEVLQPFSAEFKVQRNIIPLGRLSLNFSLGADGTYTYIAHTQPGMLAGLFSRHEVIEESQGYYHQGAITPHLYTYKDRTEDSENSEVRFDWRQHNAATTSQGITWSQTIPATTQDKLSQQLQVRIHLAQGEQQIDYQVADGGKLKTYHFQVDGKEIIESSYGTYQCLRVKRSKASGASDYTIWFAAELGFLPIKIERTQGGSIYRMVLDELSRG